MSTAADRQYVAVSRQTAILQQHENVASKPPAKIIGEAANTWLIATMSKGLSGEYLNHMNRM
jgi:hypothetical protein